jgi:serine/threonine protein kinase
MKTRKNKKHIGAKRLGYGVSAFVIDPPIQCKDGRDMTGYVSRVSKESNFDEITSKENKKIINKLKKIDPDQKYFLYPEYCIPGELTEENKKDGVTEKNKKYSEIMKKGNEDWWKYYDATYRNRTWKEFLKGRKKKILVESEEKATEKQIKHLFEGIELLHKNKILHNDLHPGNVITGSDGLPRIIDFARSIHNAPKALYKIEKDFMVQSIEQNYYTSYNPR